MGNTFWADALENTHPDGTTSRICPTRQERRVYFHGTVRAPRIEYEDPAYHVMARGNWLRSSLRGYASHFSVR